MSILRNMANMKTNNKYKDLKTGQMVWIDQGFKDRPFYTAMIIDSIYREKSEDLENPKLIHEGYVHCHPVEGISLPYKLYFEELIFNNPAPLVEIDEREITRQRIKNLEKEIQELKIKYEL